MMDKEKVSSVPDITACTCKNFTVKSFNHYSGPNIIGQIRTKYFSCLSDHQRQDLVYKFKNSDSEMFEEHEVFLKNLKSVFELERDIFLIFIDIKRKN